VAQLANLKDVIETQLQEVLVRLDKSQKSKDSHTTELIAISKRLQEELEKVTTSLRSATPQTLETSSSFPTLAATTTTTTTTSTSTVGSSNITSTNTYNNDSLPILNLQQIQVDPDIINDDDEIIRIDNNEKLLNVKHTLETQLEFVTQMLYANIMNSGNKKEGYSRSELEELKRRLEADLERVSSRLAGEKKEKEQTTSPRNVDLRHVLELQLEEVLRREIEEENNGKHKKKVVGLELEEIRRRLEAELERIRNAPPYDEVQQDEQNDMDLTELKNILETQLDEVTSKLEDKERKKKQPFTRVELETLRNRLVDELADVRRKIEDTEVKTTRNRTGLSSLKTALELQLEEVMHKIENTNNDLKDKKKKKTTGGPNPSDIKTQLEEISRRLQGELEEVCAALSGNEKEEEDT